MLCTYDKATGMATFSTTHLSYYVVGWSKTEVWQNPFTDVQSTDWYYESVAFTQQNGLISGTTASTFSPLLPMTRSMLVSILYRLEGSPSNADATKSCRNNFV